MPATSAFAAAWLAALRLGRGMLSALILACASSALWAAGIEIVVGVDSPAYREAAEVLRQELSARAEVGIVDLTTLAAANGRNNAAVVVVALGPPALEAALAARNAPVVALLTTRASFERAIADGARGRNGKRATAVYLDQPFARQLALVHLMLPGSARIGVLFSTESRHLLAALEAAAQQRKFSLATELVTAASGIYAALTRLLPETDALLALPDPSIFNANTLPNILLTTYRVQRPVFGFSPAYVKAGALAAVYSTPQQMARQAAEIALALSSGAPVPAPQYARAFEVSVNEAVARSLGIDFDDEASLHAMLRALESVD